MYGRRLPDTSRRGLDSLDEWIRTEVTLQRSLRRGARGIAVRRVQEWLTLHGFGLAADGNFGPVTGRQVLRFKRQKALADAEAEEVNDEVFATLVAPMLGTLQRPERPASIGQAVVECAANHLAAHPMELDRANRGPWVRLYMKGYEGTDAAWCAGFVTFVLSQAAETFGVLPPVPGSIRCDDLAEQAKRAGRFVSGTDVDRIHLTPGSLFLLRKSSRDCTHTGVVCAVQDGSFDTIEGNTNDEGAREGFEVCARSRNYENKDFILVN